LRVAGQIGARDPDKLDPLVHPGARRGARRRPRLVIAAAIFGQLERPQTRRAVAVDDGDERAGRGFFEPSAHLRSHDEVLLVDHAVDLVHVDFGAAAISGIGIDAEEVLGLTDQDAVVMRVDEPVAKRRIEP
jgi:hypothetical protein